MSQFESLDLDALDGESSAVDFKSAFDPKSTQDWCELIKDIIAMTNSGGGTIVVGVADDGSPSGAETKPLLDVDPADVTNRIHAYTGQHFSLSEIQEGVRHGRRVAVVRIAASRIPIVFTAHGGYPTKPSGQGVAFRQGSVYFRHGAKSEPGTSEDLRSSIEREIERVKGFWLDGIGKVMAAPDGSTVQIVQKDVRLSDTSEATAVRLTKDQDSPALSVGTVTLRDTPEASAIRLTTDENAPTLSVMQADKLYPYRQKELVTRLAERLNGGATVSGPDLQIVRRIHKIDENPNFSYQAQHSPRTYPPPTKRW